MLIGLKLNPTHLSLPVWFVRPPFSLPVPLFPRIAGKNRGRGAAPSSSSRVHLSVEDSGRVVTGGEPQIRFVERRAEFLVGRGHSHRVQGVVRGSKSCIGRGARLGKWTSFLAPRAEFYGRCKIN